MRFMKSIDTGREKAVFQLAAVFSIIIALALPLGYLLLSWEHQSAALETEAEINARLITQLINNNPRMWWAEELRLLDILERRPGTGEGEIRRVLDDRNTLVAEYADPVKTPFLRRTAPLHDSGRIVGRIEIIRSLRPLLLRSAVAALFWGLLGIAVFATVRSIPLRALRRAEHSLAEEKERAHTTLWAIQEGVIMTDAAGNVLLMNAAAERLTGAAFPQAFGKPVEHLLQTFRESGRQPFENPVRTVIDGRTGSTTIAQCAFVAQDGIERVVSMSAAPIPGAAGTITGAVLVINDITEKARLEQEILSARKIESLGVLAGGIAHDFNNILMVIMGNIDMARTLVPPQTEPDTLLAEADTACARAQALTNQLLTFARGGAPARHVVPLAPLIRESAGFALSGSPCSCEFHLPHDLWAVLGDESQLHQVIHNLVLNAREAMKDGGGITITARNLAADSVSHLPVRQGQYVNVTIRDQGPGLPAEHRDRIFEPYFSTKQKGRGLGLATCYSILKRHGGHIAAASQAGGGAEFSLYLPSTSAPVPVPAVTAEEPAGGSGRVLVMDDEQGVLNVLGTMLKGLGYEAEFAVDGEDAVGQYAAARQTGRPFDVVMLDLTIVGGMGGRETVLRLKEIDPGVRAIASSGYSDDPVMNDCSAYGFRDILIKPYQRKDLSRVLDRVLAQPA